MHSRGMIALLGAFMLLPACASTVTLRCTRSEQHGVQDTLYFGTPTRDGVVRDDEWTQFLQDTVTPRFPHGLTVFAADGQWLGKTGIPAHVPTHVLQIVHPQSAENDDLMLEIVHAYESRFRQESVLRTKVDACYSL